jgi:hypothetical protein
MKPPKRKLPFIALGCLISLGGCRMRRQEAPERVVDVNAFDYFFYAPDTLDAGPATLRLWQRGVAYHNLEVVRLDSGHTATEWQLLAIAHRLPSWGINLGGPGFAEAGGSANATLLLEPGNYLLTCSVGSARAVDYIAQTLPGAGSPGARTAFRIER